MDCHASGHAYSNSASSHAGCESRAGAARSMRSIASRSAANRRKVALTNPAAHDLPMDRANSTEVFTAACGGTRVNASW